MALKQANTEEFKSYQKQVVANCKALCQKMQVSKGRQKNAEAAHQGWIDVASPSLTPELIVNITLPHRSWATVLSPTAPTTTSSLWT